MTGPSDLDFARLNQIFGTVRTLIRAGAVVFCVYLLKDAAIALAGEETKLGVELSVLADVKFAITVTVAGSAAAWAVLERRLRHHKVEQLQGRIKQLERMLDPNRTSSGLTPRGQTNPTDRGM